jgi:hypothetical protein
VRRQHADDADAAGRCRAAARQRQLEGERPGATDDLVAVPRGQHPVAEQLREALAVLLGHLGAEVVPDHERAAELLRARRRADLDQSFSSGA